MAGGVMKVSGSADQSPIRENEDAVSQLVARVKELEDFISEECTFPTEDPIAGSLWFGSTAVVRARVLVGMITPEDLDKAADALRKELEDD